jgi:hypothetical protein
MLAYINKAEIMEWLQLAALSGLVQLTIIANKLAPFCGLLAGISAVKAYQHFNDEKQGWTQFWAANLVTGLVLGPVAYFWLEDMTRWFGFDGGTLPTWQLYFHAAGIPAGIALVFAWGRYLAPRIEHLKAKATRRNAAERNRRTDVREIRRHLPDASTAFDPLRYMDASKGVFFGLNEAGVPQYVSVELWRRSHVQIIGTTGTGKGVASAVLLSQSLRDGEAVVVMDPKDDEWAPHVLRAECERQGVPFRLVDLRAESPQIDLIDGATPDQLEELLVAGFALSEKGDAADFYRIADRQTARLAGQILGEEGDESWTILDIANHPAIRKAKEAAPGFVGKIDELARVTAISGAFERHLSTTVADGGCLYVIGSMRNERVRIAQRMLLVRLLQLVETRDRVKSKPRTVCCFLDELKYHLSRPALEGLGAARDKGLHLILAHQSLADLHDCPADLDGDAVVGAVVENCGLRIAYRLKDPETAKWLGAMSGNILVDDESRKIERNLGLSELIDSERTVRQAERFLIDVNMLLNLPAGVAAIYGEDLPFFAHICPLKIVKRPLETVADERAKRATSVTAVPCGAVVPQVEPLPSRSAVRLDCLPSPPWEVDAPAVVIAVALEIDQAKAGPLITIELEAPAVALEIDQPKADPFAAFNLDAPAGAVPAPENTKPVTIRTKEFPHVDF